MKEAFQALLCIFFLLPLNSWATCTSGANYNCLGTASPSGNTACNTVYGDGVKGDCRVAKTASQADVSAAVGDSGAGGYGTLNSDGTARSGTFDGDAVYVPAGSATWTTGVSWADKNILVKGAGQGSCTFSVSSASCTCNPSLDTCITGDQGFGVNINTVSKAQFRVSKFYFSSSSAGPVIFSLNSMGIGCGNSLDTLSFGWRLDHITTNLPNAFDEGSTLNTHGITQGVIDHLNAILAGEAAICPISETYSEWCNWHGGSGVITALSGASLMATPFSPGASGWNKNTYVEDSNFWTPASTIYDGYYMGARIVFRYNHFYNSTWTSHNTEYSAVNSLWFEFYNNWMDGTLGIAGGWYPFKLPGGGTGVVFNNTVKNWGLNAFVLDEYRLYQHIGDPLGGCNGTHAWDGNAGDTSAPGWPCIAATGRNASGIAVDSNGNQQPATAGSFPLYLWNNGPQDKCSDPNASGDACDGSISVTVSGAAVPYFLGKVNGSGSAHNTGNGNFGNGDVDWCVTASQPTGSPTCGTHTLSYTPTVHPHPLQGGAPDGTITLGSGGGGSTINLGAP